MMPSSLLARHSTVAKVAKEVSMAVSMAVSTAVTVAVPSIPVDSAAVDSTAVHHRQARVPLVVSEVASMVGRDKVAGSTRMAAHGRPEGSRAAELGSRLMPSRRRRRLILSRLFTSFPLPEHG
jgi:hypothetical protein